MKKNKLLSVFALLLCSATLCLGHMSAFAATTSKNTTSTSTTNAANTLKISPLRTDITLAPGASGKVVTYVTNLTKATVTIKPYENDFVAGDEKGTPSVILDENSHAPTHSLKRFMKPVANVTVGPGETKQVEVTIAVPKDAQAGGYYGAVRFAPATTTGDKSVNLSASAVSLVLLTVPGPVTERLSLTNFDIQQNGGTATNFRTPDDLSLLLRFENKGNIQEGPFGQIYVQKGKKIVYSSNFNQDTPKQVVLPDSARRWLVPLKGFGKFGKYTVGATFSYGAKGQSIEITKTVWIVPTAVIMAIVIGVLVLAAIIGGMWIFLKNYKRRILKSSRRRY